MDSEVPVSWGEGLRSGTRASRQPGLHLFPGSQPCLRHEPIPLLWLESISASESLSFSPWPDPVNPASPVGLPTPLPTPGTPAHHAISCIYLESTSVPKCSPHRDGSTLGDQHICGVEVAT